MRVLQLIDSLQIGGAERVAVNFANALVGKVDNSFLCATRAEGLLKETLLDEVGYLFLNKKSVFDFKAVLKLHKYIKVNKINIIHAHSTSFFLATIIKILNPKTVLIWHDHYGNSEFLNKRPKRILQLCAPFFNHVFSVNTRLESWAKEHLKTKSVNYLPNFADLNHSNSITKLKGVEGKRIVCLANLRPQKDHINLLNAFREIAKKYHGWSLHLVGQDFNDAYSDLIKLFLKDNNLAEQVFMYRSCPDTLSILKQADMGVLSSKSEGLPLSLLEYGLAGLPVVATNVGDCHQVISNSNEGQLVPAQDVNALAKALLLYIEDSELRQKAGETLFKKVTNSFSKESIIESVLRIYKKFQA
jgi:glycosyltransferase involved in cell wall biosynthesis